MIIYPHLIEHLKDVDESINFNNIENKNQDIKEIISCHIKGTIKWERDNLYIDLIVNTNLILFSTRTLKDINYELSFPLNLIVGNHKEADFKLSDEFKLGEIVYGHIILEKPLSIYDEDEEVYIDKTKRVNPIFEQLKDIKF